MVSTAAKLDHVAATSPELGHLIGSGVFMLLSSLAPADHIAHYAICAIAEFIYFTGRQRFSRQRSIGTIIIASLGCIYSFPFIVGSGAGKVPWGLVLMVFGLPVYLSLRRDYAET